MSATIYYTVSNDSTHYSGHSSKPSYYFALSTNTEIVEQNTPVFSSLSDEDINSLYKILSIKSSKNTGLLPPGVVAIDDSVIIFEAPPRMVRVEYYETVRDHINSDSQIKSGYIPVPWQTYIIIHDKNFNLIDTYMYYNKHPVSQSGYQEPVFLPVLPNFYSSGLLCRPFYASAEDVNMYSKDVSGVIAAAYDAVWNSGWNMDLVDSIIDFNTDIRRQYLYGRKQMLEYFENHPVNFKERFSNYVSMGSFHNREIMFAMFVKLMEGLNEADVLNISYPIISQAQHRGSALDQLRDEIRESYYCDEDEEYSDEDIDSYVEDNLINFWSQPTSFAQILNYVLASRYADLNIIDPVNNDYFKHIFKQVLNAPPVVQQVSYSDEEPF
jgi:hypothetical protein